VTEGDAGTTPVDFTVSLSAASGLTVTVAYTTADVTATVADGDFAGTSGTLTFNPGEVSKTVTVDVNGDTADEGVSETFNVTLSSPSNATILDATGVGTITDDDDPPTISINDPTAVTEGDAGTTPVDFTVSLSAASGLTVTVAYTTADVTATVAGGDFAGTSGTLTFNPGEVSKTVTVDVNGDTADEGVSETFNVNLSSPSNATILDATGVGTITDDDP
jgi:hypothetical protein